MKEVITLLLIIVVLIMSTTFTMHKKVGFPPKSGWYAVGVLTVTLAHGFLGVVLIHAADYVHTGQWGMFLDFTVFSSFFLCTFLSILVCVGYLAFYYIKEVRKASHSNK